MTDWGTPIFGAWYRWAYNNSEQNIRLYGSVLMSYNDAAEYTSDPGVYGIRTSGYSQFRDNKIPVSGSVVDLTAIYTKFTNGSGNYATYHLTLNTDRDVVVK